MTQCRVIHDKNNPYLTINTTIAEDSRLSWKAKGIWLYAFSRKDDWKFYISDLIKRSADGQKSLSAGLKELEDFGYLCRFKKRNEKNQFDGWEWIFFETCKSREEIKIMFPTTPFRHYREKPKSAKWGSITSKDSSTNKKEQQQEPAAAAAVFFCLEDKKIPQNEKEWICLNFTEDKVLKAVAFCDSPNTKIDTTYIQTLKWACRAQPDIPESKDTEVIMESNKKETMRIFGHLDMRAIEGKNKVPIQFNFGNKYLELACGGKTWKYFDYKKSGCIKEIIETVKEHFPSLHKLCEVGKIPVTAYQI